MSTQIEAIDAPLAITALAARFHHSGLSHNTQVSYLDRDIHNWCLLPGYHESKTLSELSTYPNSSSFRQSSYGRYVSFNVAPLFVAHLEEDFPLSSLSNMA